MVGNKNVISADLENADKGLQLQKSLYLGYYAAHCNQTFLKTNATVADNKSVTLADLESVGQGRIS